MFWKYAPLISQIDTLLEKEDITLTKILDEDDVLQECRVQNAKLIKFLVKPDNLQELVKFVTEDPPTDAEDAVRFKYPNIACELLTCDVNEINEALTNEDTHLDMMYSYLQSKPPLNPLTASFLVKVLGMLTQKRSEKMFAYIKEKNDFLDLLLLHIGTSAIVDYLIKLLRDAEPDEMKNKFVEWITDQGLVRKLIAGMDPSHDSDKHYHTSQCVCELISMCRDTLSQSQENADISILLDTLESSSTVTELLTFMFKDEKPKESVLINGLKIILALFNKKKNESHLGVLEPGTSSSVVNESDLVRLAQAASNAVESVLPKLPNFVHLLHNPPQQHYDPMPTQNGLLSPLGATRLCIVSLVDALLCVNAPVANFAVHEHQLLKTVLELFINYPLNSFLHHICLNIITTVLSSGTSQEESINKLQHQLLFSCDLISFLLDAYDNSRGRVVDRGVEREQDELFRPAHHDGHIAHVFKIASILSDNANNGTHKEYLTDLMNGLDEKLKERWSNFVTGPLQKSIDNGAADAVNEDSMANLSDIPRLGTEEFGFLEEEFDQLQQKERFEALFANRINDLDFDSDFGQKERMKDEDEDNLWDELSALSPRRNEDAIRGPSRDTRLTGLSSDNGDDDPEPQEEAEDTSSDEDLDSPVVIRQKNRKAEKSAPDTQEAMDVDDHDEWADFDNRLRNSSTMDTTPSEQVAPDAPLEAKSSDSWAAFGDDSNAKEDTGWADFASAEPAPAAAAGWACFEAAGELKVTANEPGHTLEQKSSSSPEPTNGPV